MVVKPNDKIGILVSLVTCAIFGLYPPASRGAYADGANVTFVLWLTTFFRTALLFIFCWYTNKSLFQTKQDRKLALTGGFCQAISVIGIISALAFTPGPIVMIIVFTHTLMLLFFMAWKKEIILDRATVMLTLLALIGLGLVLDFWNVQGRSNWIGFVLAFMAALATLSRLYVYGNQMKTRSPAAVGAESFLVASFLVLFIAFWQMPVMPASLAGWGWACLCALSLGTATFGMFYGIALLGSFRWSFFAKVEPVFTAIFSALLLNEYLKFYQYMGIVLVLGSLGLYQFLEHRKKQLKPVALEIS
ncbi:MAG: DMT family transporter [Alphaproteobacteria bacterium]|nr:DMT family transporter [Alphaproteobacteria bacterium]